MNTDPESMWWKIARFFSRDDLSDASADAKAQAMIEVGLFTANFALSVTGALLVAVVAYLWIHRNQKKNMDLSTRKERLEMLHALEATIPGLHSRMSIVDSTIHGERASNDEGLFDLRSALDDREWQVPGEGHTSGNFKYGRRIWLIRPWDEACIDSQAHHEILVWFRRAERAVRSGLVGGDDLFRMWRQILPFVINGRYRYLKHCFSREVRSVRDVAGLLIADCQCSRDPARDAPLQFLPGADRTEGTGRIDDDCLDDLKDGIEVRGRLGGSRRVHIDPSLVRRPETA